MHDVITIGTGTRDVFLFSPLFKVLRDKKHLKKIGFATGEAQCFALGGKIEIGKPVFATGGGANNSATTFSRQGLKTAALMKIGADEAGQSILNELKNEKVDIISRPGRDMMNGTAYSTVLLAPEGERTILVYRGISENLSEKEISFNKLKSKWAYVSPGKISFETISKIFNHFHKNKILIAFNPSKHFIEMGIKKIKPLLNKSKVVILNREEASYLTGVDYEKEKEIFKKLDEAVDGITVMTDGEKGVLVSDCCNIYKAKIFKEQKVVDRTGAGDAFGSGFVAGLIQKRENCRKGLCGIDNVEYAIRLGSANATSVIEQIGAKAGILTKEEFEKNKRWNKLEIKKLCCNPIKK
ncbi:MAG: carbohydrate kinase family protein [Patescibacteria group bacterium]|nr:carbohydrate kinase family protein [Patescibacteria group bacterium]